MSIEIKQINKAFGRTSVLNDISLDIPSGKMVALLGPSGSGKTTLLRIIAGLEHQNSGQIHFNGKDVSRIHARDRQVGFVFQHYALFRHMTVFDNIAFGLTVLPRRERPNAAEIKKRVTRLLEMVQLAHLSNRFPAQLSGGQKQLVGLAQSLIRRPELLLLDEPLSALDLNYQFHVMDLVRRETRLRNIVTVVVVHDINIALRHADHALMLKDGNLLADGEPSQVITPETLAQVYGVRGRIEHCSRGMPQVMIDGLAETLV